MSSASIAKRPVTRWLVDETYVKILGKWHYLYRGVDLDGQVLDCWLSATRDLPAAEAFFRRTIASTGCAPEHIVTDKATFYPSAIRTCAPDSKHTATGFCNRVISTNRCERSHGYVKSRLRPMRGLKSFDCAKRLLPSLDALQLIERGFVVCRVLDYRTPADGAICALAASLASSTSSANACRTIPNRRKRPAPAQPAPTDPTLMSENRARTIASPRCSSMSPISPRAHRTTSSSL
jgi:hypothetical protein